MKDETDDRIRRRIASPTLAILWDLFAQARAVRGWLVLVVVLATLLAVAAAFVGQTVVPWSIYPAL